MLIRIGFKQKKIWRINLWGIDEAFQWQTSWLILLFIWSQLSVKMTEKKHSLSPNQSSQRRHLPVSPTLRNDLTHSPGKSTCNQYCNLHLTAYHDYIVTTPTYQDLPVFPFPLAMTKPMSAGICMPLSLPPHSNHTNSKVGSQRPWRLFVYLSASVSLIVMQRFTGKFVDRLAW